MKALHVFDMDRTLIREWDGWIEPVVSQARRSIANPDVHAVLLSGRPDGLLRSHTIKQLRSKDLQFAEVRLAPMSEDDVTAFKRREMERLIRRVTPEFVEVWDDRAENLRAFAVLLKHHDIPHRLNKVEP